MLEHTLSQVGIAIPRIAVGVFFAISGYHKIFNKARHERLLHTLVEDHVPAPKIQQWWVPFWELASGGWLAVGMNTQFNAAVLIIICAVACWAEARAKVAKYGPIDLADVVDDYLYLPEVLYLVMLISVIFTGGGDYSLDAFFSAQ